MGPMKKVIGTTLFYLPQALLWIVFSPIWVPMAVVGLITGGIFWAANKGAEWAGIEDRL